MYRDLFHKTLSVSIFFFAPCCCQYDDVWINLISFTVVESFLLNSLSWDFSSCLPLTICRRQKSCKIVLQWWFCDDNVSDVKWHSVRMLKASLEHSWDSFATRGGLKFFVHRMNSWRDCVENFFNGELKFHLHN